jgi:hypothetical protein
MLPLPLSTGADPAADYHRCHQFAPFSGLILQASTDTTHQRLTVFEMIRPPKRLPHYGNSVEAGGGCVRIQNSKFKTDPGVGGRKIRNPKFLIPNS